MPLTRSRSVFAPNIKKLQQTSTKFSLWGSGITGAKVNFMERSHLKNLLKRVRQKALGEL